MKAIKWLKMCYSGLDLGAIYPVEKEWSGEYDGFFLITDDFGRGVTLHKRYLGIFFAEANYAGQKIKSCCKKTWAELDPPTANANRQLANMPAPPERGSEEMMYFEKRFRVSVRCICGEKLDAYLADVDQNEYDFVVIVDNTHICSAAKQSPALDAAVGKEPNPPRPN